MGSTGSQCDLQNVRYELRAEEYVVEVEWSMESPRSMERS